MKKIINILLLKNRNQANVSKLADLLAEVVTPSSSNASLLFKPVSLSVVHVIQLLS